MIPSSFDYFAPKTIGEAVRALANHGDEAKLLAGGHSLLPLMRFRLANPKLLVDLTCIPGLAGITRQNDTIVIGALATHYQIESSKLLKQKCPLLPQTAGTIGDVQVRNRGTIGGSLAHADPAADWPAAMLALAAELNVRGPNGVRRLTAEGFVLGPMTTGLEPAEILTEIRVPVSPRRSGSAYLKISQQASGFAIVGVAVELTLDRKGLCQEVGIGVTGLSARPFRAHSVEERLRGNKLTAKAIERSAAHIVPESEPLEDIHASGTYRVHLARICTSRALRAAARRASS